MMTVVFDGKGSSLDGYLNEYREFIFFYLNSLIDKTKILESQWPYGLGRGLSSRVLLVIECDEKKLPV